jgi:uncharacterized integral membrane protein
LLAHYQAQSGLENLNKKRMNKKWFFVIINFILIIILSIIYKHFINKGFILNLFFILSAQFVFWGGWYFIRKLSKKI